MLLVRQVPSSRWGLVWGWEEDCAGDEREGGEDGVGCCFFGKRRVGRVGCGGVVLKLHETIDMALARALPGDPHECRTGLREVRNLG